MIINLVFTKKALNRFKNMSDEITVDDLGLLVKTALTGTENQKKAAIKLLSLMPEYFNSLKQPEKTEKECKEK